MATVHPYKGYLNTKFHFYAKGIEDITYKIYSIEKGIAHPILNGYFSPNIPHSINPKKAGYFKIDFSDGTSSEIIVEDGYKFGGSSYKNSFIFDETPWCFIIMNDRTYFYNRDTDESYVESISPDKITPISNDYVIFENIGQEERTVYSLKDQKPILNISNIVFYSNDIVIWKEEGRNNENIIRLVLYKLSEGTSQDIPNVNDFIIDNEENSLIYVSEQSVKKTSLTLPLSNEQTIHVFGEYATLVSPNLIITIEKYWNHRDVCLIDTRTCKITSRIRVESPIATINTKKLIDVSEKIKAIGAFDLSLIGCEEVCIRATFSILNFYPTDWDIYYTVDEYEYERNYRKSTNRHSYEIKSISTGESLRVNRDIDAHSVSVGDTCICFSNYNETAVFGKHMTPLHSENIKIFSNNNNFFKQEGETTFVLDDQIGWKALDQADYSFQYFNEFGIIINKDDNTCFDLYGNTFSGLPMKFNEPYTYLRIGEKIILTSGTIVSDIHAKAISESGKFGLDLDNDGVTLILLDRNNVIRKKILMDLYDSSSYRSVLLSEDGSQIMYRDNHQTIVLDLNSNKSDSYDNVSYLKDINGIRPLFSRRAGSLQPRLVNPVTGQNLSFDRMPNYQFISPNGLLYADTELNKYIEFWSLISNKHLSITEVNHFANSLSYTFSSQSEIDKINKDNRRRFIEDNLCFFKKSCAEQGWRERPDKALVESLLLLSYNEFAEYFIEKRGVACIRNMADESIVAKIALGTPLWFLNYVSFSYDNRYVAIAGRYPNNSNFGGLFLVYDLIENREVIVQKNSWAVWMATFNKDNRVAAYSSEPISYDAVLHYNDVEAEVEHHRGYNFLTFSPDGKFAALSNQGYVSKYDKNGNERSGWGHRPSCEVFVVESTKMDIVLNTFSDLSDNGIDGMSDRKHNFPKTVSSVSFSNDNKRLMMVGNDGVVIIRNLHLDKYAV